MTLSPANLADLRVPHCVRFATYPDSPSIKEEIQRWKDTDRLDGPPLNDQRPIEEEVVTRKLPDVLMVLHQARLEGVFTPEEVAEICLESSRRRPLPEAMRFGLTSVVLARVDRMDRDRSAEAKALLAALIGHTPLAVRGGPLVSGVELWAASDDLDWLVLLCDDDDPAEEDAASRLYAALWVVETSFHKILHQYAQLPPERKRLESERKHLQYELDRLSEALEQSDRADSPESLRAALAQNARTTKAHRGVIETVGRVRMMQTSIEANRANMVAFRSALGDGPGQSALDLRLQRADQEIQQIRTDIDYCEPLLQAVHYTCELHRTQLMTVMSITEKEENRQREQDAVRRSRTEKEENRQREQDAVRRSRFEWRVAILGLWIGFMQISTGILSTFFTSGASDIAIKAWILAAPTLLLGVWGAWRLFLWFRGDHARTHV